MKKISLFWVIIIALVVIWSVLFVYAHDLKIEQDYRKRLEISKSIYSIAEEGYYEGQKDALEGDIRILLVQDTTCNTTKWIWLKSPWNNGRKPVFNP
jgi:hypothetical protein